MTIRRVLLLAAALCASVASPAAAQMMLVGAGSAGAAAAADPLAAVVATMAHGEWKPFTKGTDGDYMQIIAPATCGTGGTPNNFDGSADVGGTPCSATGTWTDDAHVAAAGVAGVGGASVTSAWSFSGAGVCVNGNDIVAVFLGGGHADSGRGDIVDFSFKASAASILAGNGPGGWVERHKPARYIDVFTHPSGKPAWSFETTGTPSVANDFYWATTNIDGEEMPLTGHTYHGTKCVPNSTKVVFNVYFGYGDGGSAFNNSVWYYDYATHALSGPFQTATPNNTVGNMYGLAIQPVNGTGGAVAFDDIDGLPYSYGKVGCCNFELIHWTNFDNSSLAVVLDTNSQQSSNPPALTDAVIIPDPQNPAQRVWFQLSSTTGTGGFYLVRGLNSGGAFTYSVLNGPFANTLPAVGTGSPALAWDGTHILVNFGDEHVYWITPSASDTGWTFTEPSTTYTGDLPSNAVSDTQPNMAWDAAHQVLAMCNEAQCRLYRP